MNKTALKNGTCPIGIFSLTEVAGANKAAVPYFGPVTVASRLAFEHPRNAVPTMRHQAEIPPR